MIGGAPRKTYARTNRQAGVNLYEQPPTPWVQKSLIFKEDPDLPILKFNARGDKISFVGA